MNILTETEARIIGSLIEKENTTPDYYPMTVNGLTNACNQKSNRDPVVNYAEKTIELTLDELREKKYACRVTGSDMRVPKYKQIFTQAFEFTKPETAIICVLLLRGPQTLGEIRGRTGRIYEFNDLVEVDDALQKLINREIPLVVKLPRVQGRDPRYAHLFCGQIQVEENKELAAETDKEKISRLENAIEELKGEIADLKNQFSEFKKQFE
jgi:Uncharacterized protein conserved in bacteria